MILFNEEEKKVYNELIKVFLRYNNLPNYSNCSQDEEIENDLKNKFKSTLRDAMSILKERSIYRHLAEGTLKQEDIDRLIINKSEQDEDLDILD